MTSGISDVTDQATKTELFSDQPMKVLTSQVETKRGTSKAQNLFAVGFASSPVKKDRLIVQQIGSFLFAVGGSTREIEETLNLSPGERCIFSTDENGAIVQRLYFDTNGVMTLDDGSDHAVRYSILETAFNELKGKFNDLVDVVEQMRSDTEIFAAAYVPGSPAAIGTPPSYPYTATTPAQSAADITDAEVSTFKLPTKSEE
jgi:hypothetical protein